MSDLVEQARNPDAGAFDSPAQYAAHLEGLCQELADEVEKLRHEMAETAVANVAATKAAVGSYQAEIKRLRADLAAIGDSVKVAAQALNDEERDLERLRGLLREARDDVAECMGQETKPHRIKANKVRLAAIDEAISD